MSKKQTGFNTFFRTSIIVVLFICMAGVIAWNTDVFDNSPAQNDGLSGLVSVKGTVKLKDLNLSKNEVKQINRAVSSHKTTFVKIDLFLDVKDGSATIDKDTVLVWAMALDTPGDCEVRSWSRKVSRGDLVGQMVVYMSKAAKEYKEFKKFPDVKQNFKCLYI